MQRTIIRNATIVSMDPEIGILEKGDVLIEGDRIGAVGPSVDASDAQVVDATGTILMPGLIDVHRHVWQGVTQGLYIRELKLNYFDEAHMRIGALMSADETYLGSYLGGLVGIESGITTMVDHCHLAQTREKGHAAAKGLLDSGIAGIFCYQVSASPTYRPGETLKRSEAWAQLFGPSDEWHFDHAVEIRRELFPSDSSRLTFGIALSPTELMPGTPEAICAEMRRVRELGPALITHHLYGYDVAYSDGRPGTFRGVAALAAAGLLGPDYQVSHGNLLTPDEFRALGDAGAAVAATPLCELNVGPPIHFRARSFGARAGIGIDTPISLSSNYFEELRYAHLSTHELAKKDSLPDSLFRPHSVSLYDSLWVATLGAAESIGLGSVTGSLTKGKRADIVMLKSGNLGVPLATDPLKTIVGYSTVQDVDSVWVAGERRKQHGRLTGIDIEGLRQKAHDARQSIQEKAASVTFTV